MKTSVINKRVLDKLALAIAAETRLPFSFEIQEDGKFLLVDIEGAADESLGEKLALLMDEVMPRRLETDTWMVVFTQGGRVVDSYGGGMLAHG
ncbi:MAG TPA: hypothetical protein VFX55_09335 [Duganella sp.]|nr:hypothetical protein [Duganella sp.]